MNRSKLFELLSFPEPFWISERCTLPCLGCFPRPFISASDVCCDMSGCSHPGKTSGTWWHGGAQASTQRIQATGSREGLIAAKAQCLWPFEPPPAALRAILLACTIRLVSAISGASFRPPHTGHCNDVDVFTFLFWKCCCKWNPSQTCLKQFMWICAHSPESCYHSMAGSLFQQAARH